MQLLRPCCDWKRPYAIVEGCAMVHDGTGATVRVEFSPGVGIHGAGQLHVLRRGGAYPLRKSACYGITPQALLIDARQFRALSGFLAAGSPRDVFRRVAREDRWRVAEFKYFVDVLVINRILAPLDEPARPVAPAANRESIGVIILALGAEYIRMACSLAATIKVGNPELPIALDQIPIDPAEYGDDGKASPYLMKLYIEGTAGIGLALLAATSDIEPDWDRLLLVSIPPHRAGSQT